MAEKISEIIKEILPVEEVLEIHSPESTFCSFYELKTQYGFVIEEFNVKNNYINYSVMTPNHFSIKKEILTDSILMDRPLHQHDFFEMMFVLNGTCVQWIEEQKYQYHVGQCCLINHNVRHVEMPEEHTELFFVIMSDEIINTMMHNDLLFNKDGQIIRNRSTLYHFF